MSGIEALLDTNAILYFLDGIEEGNRAVSLFPVLFYSTITRIELLSYPDLKPEDAEQILQFLETCREIPITDLIRDITIEFRKKYRIKVPDAVIAATAHSFNIPLLTYDRGFGKITEISKPLLIS